MAVQPMSAEDARTFQGFSLANAVTVKSALRARGCACEPYADVFTFGRWIAQGRAVRKGEHGIRLPVIIAGQQDTHMGRRNSSRWNGSAARSDRKGTALRLPVVRCHVRPKHPRSLHDHPRHPRHVLRSLLGRHRRG